VLRNSSALRRAASSASSSPQVTGASQSAKPMHRVSTQCKKVKVLLVHLKSPLKLYGLRLRSPDGAKEEFVLAATAQNLRKWQSLS
jgi:hypothetical protein